MKKAVLFSVIGVGILITILWVLAQRASNQVVESFWDLNEKIVDNNDWVQQTNDSMVSKQGFGYGQHAVKAELLDSVSNSLYTYISVLKEEALGNLDPNNYELMDKSIHLDTLFFEGESISKRGAEFMNEIEQYRTLIATNFKDQFPDLVAKVNEDFSTNEVTNRAGEKRPWLFYNYHGFPLIASLVKLSSVQSDVERTQQGFLNAMLSYKE